MINLKKIIDESLDSIWSPRQYGATSMAPRKDQGPLFSQKDGKNFPYQQNTPPVFPPSLPEPENPLTFPWPMETINTDLSDGFVFLLNAAKKINQCAKQNSSISNEQKEKLIEVFNNMLQILKSVEKIGTSLPSIVNMSLERSPQVPVHPSKSPYIPMNINVGNQDNPNIQAQKL